MPITYDVDHDRKRVLAVARGDAGFDVIVAFTAELASRQLLSYSQRLDARGASALLTAEETRRFVTRVARLRQTAGQARTAFVTDADASFGMARMYATLAADSDTGFMVCRTMAEADEWLGWNTDVPPAA